MRSLKPRSFPAGALVLVIASLLYPGVVYVGRAVIPALAFVTVALALIALRLVTLRSRGLPTVRRMQDRGSATHQ
jgi:hypothetical protein